MIQCCVHYCVVLLLKCCLLFNQDKYLFHLVTDSLFICSSWMRVGWRQHPNPSHCWLCSGWLDCHCSGRLLDWSKKDTCRISDPLNPSLNPWNFLGASKVWSSAHTLNLSCYLWVTKNEARSIKHFNAVIKVKSQVSHQTFEASATAFYCSVFPVLLFCSWSSARSTFFFILKSVQYNRLLYRTMVSKLLKH